METLFRTHKYLLEHTEAPVRRMLMDEIDWSHRMIGIKGTRGVGKTTFLLQYAKEVYGTQNRECLYINMNNFYFQNRCISDFAEDFVRQGGKVLLIDQVFKHKDWSADLRRCYDRFPGLQIIFTGSSVMRLKEENPELNTIVESYNLRGFSFREFLNLKTGLNLRPYSLDEILSNAEQIIKDILPKVSPNAYFADYIHHGFYPFFLENRNFSENLLKTMNMTTEVDILLIKQIDLKYLTKIKELFYLLAIDEKQVPNISNLAMAIDTSRATVMNYIKYLADGRLINIVYPKGQNFPKKPSRILLNNSNLIYTIYPYQPDQQTIMETFFANALLHRHRVNQGHKDHGFIIDDDKKFRICDTQGKKKIRYNPETIYVRYNTEIGKDNKIPIWLFGFLY